MLYKYSSLILIDLYLFNVNNIEDMRYIFLDCLSLSAINLSSFITKNISLMNGMFLNFKCLNDSFYTNNINNMNEIFNLCSCLKKILK
jgi:hypothetical protein